MKANSKNVVLLLLLVAVFIFAAVIITDMVAEEDKFEYYELVRLMDEDLIDSFVLDVEGYMTLVTVANNADGTPVDYNSIKGLKGIAGGKQYVYRLGYRQCDSI